MKIKYYEILNAVSVLRGTEENPGLTARPGLDVIEGFIPLDEATEALGPHIERYGKAVDKMREKYGEDENLEENEEFLTEWNELLNTEVELDCKPVKAKAFANMTPAPSFAELKALGPILSRS